MDSFKEMGVAEVTLEKVYDIDIHLNKTVQENSVP